MDLTARLRADLGAAMKAKDRVAVTALRTALAAIANAEAPPADGIAPSTFGQAEHERLELTESDVERIVRAEIVDREDTIARFESGGAVAEADDLRAEIAVLRRYLPGFGT